MYLYLGSVVLSTQLRAALPTFVKVVQKPATSDGCRLVTSHHVSRRAQHPHISAATTASFSGHCGCHTQRRQRSWGWLDCCRAPSTAGCAGGRRCGASPESAAASSPRLPAGSCSTETVTVCTLLQRSALWKTTALSQQDAAHTARSSRIRLVSSIHELSNCASVHGIRVAPPCSWHCQRLSARPIGR